MAQIQYRITETFLPGSPQQREERLRALLAEYRQMLELRALQQAGPEAGEGSPSPGLTVFPADDLKTEPSAAGRRPAP